MASFPDELRAASAVTVPSESHRRAMSAHLSPDFRLEVLPLGSDESPPLEPRPRSGPLRILHFGNLSRLKGVAFLIDAVRRVAGLGVPIRLTLAGAAIDQGLDLGSVEAIGPYDQARLR